MQKKQDVSCKSINQEINIAILMLSVFPFFLLLASGCQNKMQPLGENEALRVYTEFADGGNRGMYDPVTDSKGFPDEEYDATPMPWSSIGTDCRKMKPVLTRV